MHENSMEFNEVFKMSLGKVVKRIREDRSLTLKELSELSGISVSHLSKLENDKTKLSVDALRKLADALGVPLSNIMMTQEVPRISPVRACEGFVVNRDTAIKPVLERYLTIRRSARMQPMIMTFPIGTNSGPVYSHLGDEFFYVLEGEVRFFYGEETTFDMLQGDFLYYDCSIPHRWENIGKTEKAVLLVCNTPPVI